MEAVAKTISATQEHVATTSASAQSNDLRRVGCHAAAVPHWNDFRSDSMRVLPSSCYITPRCCIPQGFPLGRQPRPMP